MTATTTGRTVEALPHTFRLVGWPESDILLLFYSTFFFITFLIFPCWPPWTDDGHSNVWPTPWHHKQIIALLKPKTPLPIQKCHPYTENPRHGDSRNAFLHQGGVVACLNPKTPILLPKGHPYARNLQSKITRYVYKVWLQGMTTGMTTRHDYKAWRVYLDLALTPLWRACFTPEIYKVWLHGMTTRYDYKAWRVYLDLTLAALWGGFSAASVHHSLHTCRCECWYQLHTLWQDILIHSVLAGVQL